MDASTLATVPGHVAVHLERHLGEIGCHLPSPAVPRRVPAGMISRLWDDAFEAQPDPLLGVRTARRVRADEFGLLERALATSTSVGDHLMLLCHLMPLVTDSIRFRLTVRSTVARLELEVDEPALLHPLSAEHIITMVLDRLPTFDGTAIAHFVHHARGPIQDHADALGVPVRFAAGWYGLEVPATALLVARPTAPDPSERRAVLALAERHLVPIHTVVDDVRASIQFQLDAGRRPMSSAIARDMGLHPKTLGRRLAARGTSFRSVLDQERLVRARDLLATRRSIDDVARDLGFTETSAFTRAFKRWTGRSPSQHRAESRRPPTMPKGTDD
jgi:AraC-like DNA-binding protein